MKRKEYVFVCTSKDCKKNGSEKVLKTIKGRIKAGGQKEIEVIKTKCMGSCKKGPNVIVSNCMYHQVKEKDVPVLLDTLTPMVQTS